jgi:hypothetical protein
MTATTATRTVWDLPPATDPEVRLYCTGEWVTEAEADDHTAHGCTTCDARDRDCQD